MKNYKNLKIIKINKLGVGLLAISMLATNVAYADNTLKIGGHRGAEQPSVSQTADVPSIDELKDSSTPYGLNLENVTKRQRLMRKMGNAKDISTKIELFRSEKGFIANLVNEKVALEKKRSELLKNNKKSKEAKEIDKELQEVEVKIDSHMNVQKKFMHAIMEQLGLDATQVAHIPAKDQNAKL